MKKVIKMSFDQVNSFFNALDYAFHPRGISKDEGPDDKFIAIWTIFLNFSGWTENEYWDADSLNDDCICDECKNSQKDNLN